ncbi:MAG TPA: PQQ-binding-like beta-propeller repeat protein [Vicinamibacteria bacterium]|nr:PQQ-binding-like beta-propeller repeat protein [Vicinamibacteria bacterium]
MLRRHARAIAALACVAAWPLLAAQPQFFRIEGARDFLDGDNDGVSVDSEGQLRLAPLSKMIYDTEAPFLWCLARDGHGNVYAGTGNDGRVFRVGKDGKSALAFDAPELEVHALALGPDGRLFVGTSPDGKVYAVDAAGIGVPFFDPEERYIWALAFDASGQLHVATGSEGKVYRVDSKGQAKALLTASDTHVMSLALGPQGDVYAGSSPSGILYRVDASGKVSVLHDSAFREIKALERSPDGSLYAVAVDGKAPDEPRPAPAPVPPTPPPPSPTPPAGPEVTVMETFVLPPQAAAQAARADARAAAGIKGALLRVWPTGEVETLWSSNEDLPHALVLAGDGILVATGNKGKLYRVRDDRTWTMVASFAAEQVTALLRSDADFVLGTSNPGKLFSLGTRPGASGTFTSKAKDTETVSTWGRIRWEATLPAGTGVQIQTRAGNTANPDPTWSEWSPAYAQKDGDPILGERARYLQVRAVLSGKDGATPVVDSISAAYLQRNLRPQVQTITVHPPGEVFQKPLSVTGEIEILGLEPGEAPETRLSGAPASRAGAYAAQPTAYSRRIYQRGMQTFSWKADDPNGDTLVYDVQYRAVGDTKLRTLRRATTDTVLAWDTSTVPNGRYVIKVSARDTPANPESLALAGDKESTPFDVDNTPPLVSAALEDGRVRATVSDDWSIIKKAEYSVDGGRWHEIHPVDGINDARQERYEIAPGPFGEPGPHLLVVRATDLLGNVASARVELK